MAEIRSDWSGQVYIETVAAVNTTKHGWTAQTIGSADGFTKFRSQGKGADRLLDIATRCCLANSAYLTSEMMENVPWHVASRLWTIIKKNQLDSVSLWQAFAAAYPESQSKDGLKYRLKYIRGPKLHLIDYIAPIRSPSMSWLVILTLQDMNFTRAQIVKHLATLSNLEVLSLGWGTRMKLTENDEYPARGIDQAVIDAWGRYSNCEAEGKAFRSLRVLNLDSQPALTNLVYQNCNLFPALRLLNLINCEGVDYESPEIPDPNLGWQLVDRAYEDWATWNAKDPGSRTFSGWENFSRACLRFTRMEFGTAEAGDSNIDDDNVPRLHLLLGEDMFYPWNTGKVFRMLSYKRAAGFSIRSVDSASERVSRTNTSERKTHDLKPKRQKVAMDIKDTLFGFMS